MRSGSRSLARSREEILVRDPLQVNRPKCLERGWFAIYTPDLSRTPDLAACKTSGEPRQTHQPVERKCRLRQPKHLPFAGAGSESEAGEESDSISPALSQPHHQAEVRQLIFLV